MKTDKDELTIYEIESVHKELLDEFNKGDVSIDISSLNKIDMSAIQLLLSAKKSCQESDKTFEIIGANSEVSKIFQKSGCQSLLGAMDE